MRTKSHYGGSLMAAAVLSVRLLAAVACPAEIVRSSENGFSLEQSVILPVSPEVAFDAMTGDISGWWDHHFSEKPKALYIEPKPGGGFYEIFNENGDGVKHGTVIYSHRGRLLRFEGPLGLSGKAFTLVVTYTFEPRDVGTLVKLTVNAMGTVEDGWPEAIDGVWHHFLVERLKPYVESGRHKAKATAPYED